MAKRYLTDTCSAIKYLKGSYPKPGLAFMESAFRGGSVISFISEIELQAWDPENEGDLQTCIEFVENSSILGFNHKIIKQTIEIRKKQKLKIPDALIAATALVNGFTLVSDNEKDFKKVKGLKFINPLKLE